MPARRAALPADRPVIEQAQADRQKWPPQPEPRPRPVLPRPSLPPQFPGRISAPRLMALPGEIAACPSAGLDLTPFARCALLQMWKSRPDRAGLI